MSKSVSFEKGVGQRGFTLWHEGYRFVRNKTVTNPLDGMKTTYWYCQTKCGVTATTKEANEAGEKVLGTLRGNHEHPADYEGYKVNIQIIYTKGS